MLSDTMFQKSISFAESAVTEYFAVPYRCTVRKVSGIVQADPGDAETITFTVNSSGDSLGVLTFGSDIAAGAVGEYTRSDDTVILEEGDIIKIVTSAGAAAACDLNIELDPYARD